MELKYFEYSTHGDGITVNGLKAGVECPAELTVPEGVTGIDWDAFADSEVEVLNLPASLEEVGFRAFAGCSELRRVCFAKNSKLRVIEESAFESTAIEELKFPASLKIIEHNAFESCYSLKTVSFEAVSRLEIIEENDLTEYMQNLRKYYNNSDLEMYMNCLKQNLPIWGLI